MVQSASAKPALGLARRHPPLTAAARVPRRKTVVAVPVLSSKALVLELQGRTPRQGVPVMV